MSTSRVSAIAGWADVEKLPKGPNGRSLCRRCSTEVPKGRQTFCSKECVHEWRLRTDTGYLRMKVFERDRGVCGGCGCNTGAKRSRGTGHLWQADHITPVIEGGGECDLSNLRTLCTACHRSATAELAARRAAKRRRDRATGQSALDFGEVAS